MVKVVESYWSTSTADGGVGDKLLGFALLMVQDLIRP